MGPTTFTSMSQRPDRWNLLDLPWVSLPLLHQTVYWLTVPEKGYVDKELYRAWAAKDPLATPSKL